MKKKLTIIISVILTLLVIAGCGAKSASDMAYTESITNGSAPALEESKAETGFVTADTAALAGGTGSAEYTSSDFAEKMIYTATAEIETTKFDESVEAVYAMLDDYGAFLESSYITGQSYRSKVYNYQSYRYAEFVIRVPSAGYANMTQNLGVLGNVLSVSDGSVNITEQYYDAQSRLDTYRVEEERVLAMLEKAETVTDMIELESRLSDIRYQIESLESKLRNWQNQVDYSTVTLHINEVEELTEVVEVQRTYWQQIGDGLKSSAKGVGRFFKNLFKNVVIALPVLAVLAVAAVIVIFVAKKLFGKKAAERRREKRENKRLGNDDDNGAEK